ncbi:MAG: hypothetical protein KGZ82_12300 [Bacteroidales bacterium]|nr:hypothetical protein [Bacteroidales bacterium]
MSKLYNKWLHGKRNFVMPSIPSGFMRKAGIYYLTLVLDKEVGEEVVLIIFDPTTFIYELGNVNPFSFHMCHLVVKTNFGPVFSFLFWVDNPKNPFTAFSIYDKPIILPNPESIKPWEILANQTHIHLILLDKYYETVKLFEFYNNFGVVDSVETMKMIEPEWVIDMEQAQQEYFETYGLLDLYNNAIRANLG